MDDDDDDASALDVGAACVVVVVVVVFKEGLVFALGGSSSPVCSLHASTNFSSASRAAAPSSKTSQSYPPVAIVGSMFDPPTIASLPSTANIFT